MIRVICDLLNVIQAVWKMNDFILSLNSIRDIRCLS